MKQGKSLMERCLALVLAAVILISVVTPSLALNVFANDDQTVVSVGELMANNYASLAAAEKLLLKAKLLGGTEDTFTYTVPNNDKNDLVYINDENGEKEIVAKNYEKNGSVWVPTSAAIKVDSVAVEKDIAIVNGKANYTTTADAFSVEVAYVLNYEVSIEKQQGILNAIGYLKQGLTNISDAKAVDLSAIEAAMDSLVSMAAVEMTTPAGTYSFGDNFRTAVTELQKEMENNGGALKLTTLNASALAGTKNLMENGAAFKAAVLSTYGYLRDIQNDPMMTNGIPEAYLEYKDDKATLANWNGFKEILGETVSALAPIAADAWNALNEGVLKAGMTDADYMLLDVLLKDINGTPNVTPVAKLQAAKTTLYASKSMNSIKVKLVLKYWDGTALKDTVVEDTVPVRDNASKAEALSAIEADGIISEAKAAWGAKYADAHFDETASNLPDKLTDDAEYTITYTAKQYDITFAYETTTVEKYYYGQQIILPVHTDSSKAYDYTVVGGDTYRQGASVTVTGPLTVERVEGKAYIEQTLYAIIAQNYGNEVAQAIMGSGALKGNEAVSYRAPSSDEEKELLSLVDGVLTASAAYSSTYLGKNWVPYSYGANGNENLFVGNSAAWADKAAKVRYILNLDNADAARVKEALLTAVAIKNEFDSSFEGMNRLASYYDNVAELTKTTLNGFKGMLEDFDFGFSVEKNKEIELYFRGLIEQIVNNCVEKDENGKILVNLNMLNILDGYGGKSGSNMSYYYKNSAYIIGEVDKLSSYLTGLVADEEKQAALGVFLEAIDKGEFVEKISNLGTAMAEIKEDLKPTNAAIDLESDKLPNLVNTLIANINNTVVVEQNPGVPYILSDSMNALDNSQVLLSAVIKIEGMQDITVTSDTFDKFAVLEQKYIDQLKQNIQAALNDKMGDNKIHFVIVDGSDALVEGVNVTANISVEVVAKVKKYTVKIDGVEDQIIDFQNLTIKLPQPNDYPKSAYVYTIDGVQYRQDSYTFKASQFDTLFVNGVYAISYETLRIDEIELDKFIDAINDPSVGNHFAMVDGKLIGTINPTSAGVQSFAAGLLKAGLYVGLNGEDFFYSTDNGLQISIQTLLNALLNDDSFGSQTLIDLANNAGGKLLVTNLQLGIDAETLYYEELDFVLSLKSAPAALSELGNALESLQNYVSFNANKGVLETTLTLPEEVYEVYLTALISNGNVYKYSVNEINNEIAFMFLYNFVNDILKNDSVTTTTYQNTLNVFVDAANKVPGVNVSGWDLTACESYYQEFRKLYNNIAFDWSGNGPVGMTATATDKGLNDILNGLNMDLSKYETFLKLIKEMKEGGTLTVKSTVALNNTDKNIEALIFDVGPAVDGAKDLLDRDINVRAFANTIDYTYDLVGRVATLKKQAMIVLLSDVTGDLVINDCTILNLNGHTITGDIIANGKLFIVDSTLDTVNCGGVDGNISGNALIIAGKYTSDVSAFLKDGYVQKNGAVQNALYTIEAIDGKVTFVLNSDVMYGENVDGYLPSIPCIAADIIFDLILKHYSVATLSVEGNEIYEFSFDDLVGMLDGRYTLGEITDESLSWINISGVNAFANQVINEMMDFGAVADAIDNDKEIFSYDITVAPWMAIIKYVADGDYITAGLVPNAEGTKNICIAMRIEGNNAKKLVALLREIANIVVEEETGLVVDLKRPVRDDHNLIVSGNADATLSVDLTVNKNYNVILAVALAYGNPDKAADLVAAIGDDEVLKALVDEITVEELCNALKAMNRGVSFETMAGVVGADVTADAAELESLWHLVCCASGKLLEICEIVGRDTKLGNLDKDGDGTYELIRSYNRNGFVDYRGYGVDYTVENITGCLKVKLFNVADCLWGDADHDGVVDQHDASLVLQYYLGTLSEGETICLDRTDVDGNGRIDQHDASLILEYYLSNGDKKFPVES